MVLHVPAAMVLQTGVDASKPAQRAFFLRLSLEPLLMHLSSLKKISPQMGVQQQLP
jgi:hypothetical protein